MSGYTGNATASLADAAFIRKPFTPHELTRKLREVLERPVEAAA